ncbi:unnamed protein product, partial [Effrenium voratum]
EVRPSCPSWPRPHRPRGPRSRTSSPALAAVRWRAVECLQRPSAPPPRAWPAPCVAWAVPRPSRCSPRPAVRCLPPEGHRLECPRASAGAWAWCHRACRECRRACLLECRQEWAGACREWAAACERTYRKESQLVFSWYGFVPRGQS